MLRIKPIIAGFPRVAIEVSKAGRQAGRERGGLAGRQAGRQGQGQAGWQVWRAKSRRVWAAAFCLLRCKQRSEALQCGAPPVALCWGVN